MIVLLYFQSALTFIRIQLSLLLSAGTGVTRTQDCNTSGQTTTVPDQLSVLYPRRELVSCSLVVPVPAEARRLSL